MTRFAVWSPERRSIAVVVDGVRTEMKPGNDGWWEVETEVHDVGDYVFELDGKHLRPDPRSLYQPDGVHGPSRLVNFAAFQWSDDRFQAPPLSSAVIYELHVGTFTSHGTFDSTIEKLSHLKRLGITHIELMPVAEFAGVRGWGYDGVYPYAPHHEYGGPAGLQRLVDACHAEGIAVILDVVYNHLGPCGNYLSQYAPYFSRWHKTPWGSAINFDGPYSDEVRRYFIDNAIMWLRDYHFDGLRIDAIHAIVDTSAVPFLEQLVFEVKQLEAHLGRHLIIIAESDLNDPRIVQSRDRGGLGFDAQWSDDFHHALHVAITGEAQGYYCDFGGVRDLASVYCQPFLFDRRFSRFRQRAHGRHTSELNGWKFLAYSQNHDQVGNRAVGERLHQIAGVRGAKIAAALTLVSPYIPLLFQGEEWASSSPFQYFVDFSEDAELARAVSRGRRRDFASFEFHDEVPDPQDVETFLRSKLDWGQLAESPHQDMLAWYVQLIALRRCHATISDGSLDNVVTEFGDDREWLTIRRGGLWIIANLAREPRHVLANSADDCEVLLASDPQARIDRNGFHLPAESVLIAQQLPHAQASGCSPQGTSNQELAWQR
jgi:maltooligosyltrehalose trehalohydrolase